MVLGLWASLEAADHVQIVVVAIPCFASQGSRRDDTAVRSLSGVLGRITVPTETRAAKHFVCMVGGEYQHIFAARWVVIDQACDRIKSTWDWTDAVVGLHRGIVFPRSSTRIARTFRHAVVEEFTGSLDECPHWLVPFQALSRRSYFCALGVACCWTPKSAAIHAT